MVKFSIALILCLILGSCGQTERGPLNYRFKEGVPPRQLRSANPQLLQSALKELLIPKCAMCHYWVKDPNQLDLRINPGRPLESSLYLRVEDGSMPPFGGGLNEGELEKVYEAIRALSPGDGPSRDYEE